MYFLHRLTVYKTEKHTTKLIQHMYFTTYLIILLGSIQETLILMFLERQLKAALLKTGKHKYPLCIFGCWTNKTTTSEFITSDYELNFSWKEKKEKSQSKYWQLL